MKIKADLVQSLAQDAKKELAAYVEIEPLNCSSYLI